MATLARLFLRKDVAATWQSANPTLGAGEPGFESDQFRLRIGNGALAFNALRAFLSVPAGAINVAQSLLNASTQAAQRTAIGITGDVSQVNALGGAAVVVTDWNDVAASGSGLYQGNAAAANRPDDVSVVGIYTKLDASNGVLTAFTTSSGASMRSWVRRFAAGAWESWRVVAGVSERVTDWDSITFPGSYWSDNLAANLPPVADIYHATAVGYSQSDLALVAIARSSNSFYIRRRVAGVWGTWRELVHTSNLLAQMKTNFPSVPYVSSEQSITAAGLLTLAHGLGATPSDVRLKLICKTAEHGYAINDEIWVDQNQSGGGYTTVHAVYANATNVYVRFANSANAFIYAHKTTGASVFLTNANWKLIVRAYP